MDEVLKELARKKQAEVEQLNYDQVGVWPEQVLEELVTLGVLKPADNATGCVCYDCSDQCWIEPDIRMLNDTGEKIGRYICPFDHCDVGAITVDLKRLQCWQINEDKLIQSGYLEKQSYPAGIIRRRKEPSNNKIMLIACLVEHHRIGTEKPNFDPMDQMSIQKKLGWSQSKTSRTMSLIFGEHPMAKYQNFCRGQLIEGFLKRLDDRNLAYDAITEDPNSDMEFLSPT